MSFKVIREGLATHLETATGRDFYPYVPGSLDAGEGVGALEAAEDYVVQGETYSKSDKVIALDLWLFVDINDNEDAVDTLDEFLALVLDHLGPWAVTRTGKPGPLIVADNAFHGMRLTVTTNINL